MTFLFVFFLVSSQLSYPRLHSWEGVRWGVYVGVETGSRRSPVCAIYGGM